MKRRGLFGWVLAASVTLPWQPARAAAHLEVRLRSMISVGQEPQDAALSADESELYVSLSGEKSVCVVGLAKGRVTGRVPLGCTPGFLALVPSGSFIIVACETGVRVIELPARRVTSVPRGRIRGLALAKDGKVAYLAEYAAGVGKMDLSTRQVSLMSPVPIATDLALMPDGNFLYVNYQHYGPGGRQGHDAIGKFDARTGKFLSAIKGLPNVGNTLAVSPDGRRLWANGDDACISRRYDHLGCPAVPAGIINIIDTATDRLVHSLPLVTGVPFGITFSPDGSLVALSGRAPCFLDSRTFEILAQVPEIFTKTLVFSRDGRRAYATLPEQNAVAVFDISRH